MIKAKTKLDSILEKKWLENFSAKSPNKYTLEIMSKNVLPSSNFISRTQRGKKMIELDLEYLDYIAFRMDNGSFQLKLLGKMMYMIRLYENLESLGLDESDFDDVYLEHFKAEKMCDSCHNRKSECTCEYNRR